MKQPTDTPLTAMDLLERDVQRLEAQLPATRAALAWERKQAGRCDGLLAEDCRPDRRQS